MLTERLVERQTESREIGSHRQRQETRDKLQRHSHREAETERERSKHTRTQRKRETYSWETQCRHIGVTYGSQRVRCTDKKGQTEGHAEGSYS